MSNATADGNKTQIFPQSEKLTGKALEGREILVCWDDGVWNDAVVVTYDESTDKHKIVYRLWDRLVNVRLRDHRWVLEPKKRPENDMPVLDGAVIEFEYPADGQRYRAMIYDYAAFGEHLKVVYIDENTTDNLKGGGWDFISDSPCLEDGHSEKLDARSGARSRSTRVSVGAGAGAKPLSKKAGLISADGTVGDDGKECATAPKQNKNERASRSTRRAENSSRNRCAQRGIHRVRR